MGNELTPEERQASRALSGHEMWATCEHLNAGPLDHRCPTCKGTLRRCCNSLVGHYGHLEACKAYGQHKREATA